MGLGLFGGSSASRTSAKRSASGGTALLPGDPNPSRFHITDMVRYGDYVVALVVWPDARNYDGRKLAVYRATRDELMGAKFLDPHFQEIRGPLVPIARFEPTDLGWRLARGTCRLLNQMEYE
jgi:hypothetical protein